MKDYLLEVEQEKNEQLDFRYRELEAGMTPELYPETSKMIEKEVCPECKKSMMFKTGNLCGFCAQKQGKNISSQKDIEMNLESARLGFEFTNNPKY